jgi:glycosyltransferase involved in cell wall biosynthesis
MIADLPAPEPARFLVDVSELVRQDARSGIQRVVRSVLTALRSSPPAGFRIDAVYDAGGYYAYAQSDAGGVTGSPVPIRIAAGDIFLGLDLCLDQVPGNEAVLADLRRHGARLFFVVYDLVPVNHPQMFHPGMPPWFSRWLLTVSTLADGLLCISRAVADELLAWLEHTPVRRADPLQIAYFHLGADLQASLPSSGLNTADQAVLAQLGQRPTFLMVGTLEPRKMHAQALQAFDLLWRDGCDVNLVIVGKAGWILDHLFERLRQHPEMGRRLFWLERASDEALQQLYRESSALLAPSLAEGFGLPLIEAAQYRLPVIARDIPVFREVGGDHAYYFGGAGALDLAEAIRSWLVLDASGQAPQSAGMPQLTWSESTDRLLNIIERGDWYCMAPTLLA